jgi:hypothetical protein
MTSWRLYLFLFVALTLGCSGEATDDDDDDDSSTADDDDDTTGGSACPAQEDLAVFEHSGTIGSETWVEGLHVVDITVWVEGGVLTVEPCAVIAMKEGASIDVTGGGVLQILGEPDRPVTVTAFGDTPSRGAWENLELQEPAELGANVIRHAVIEYGGDGLFGAVRVESGVSLTMTDTLVRDSGDVGVSLASTAELIAFEGNTLIDNAAGPIELPHDQAGQLGVGTYAPNDVEGIQLISLEVNRDQTWLAHDAPYVSDNGFTLVNYDESALLTMAAGAVLKLGEGAAIRVDRNGGLTLAGTGSDPVTITSASSTPMQGDWANIEVRDESVAEHNDFDFAVIEYGGSSQFGCVEVWHDASVAVTDSTIRQCADVGLQADTGAELRDFVDNTLIENLDGALQVGANEVDQLGYGTYGPNDFDGVLVYLDYLDHDATWLDLDVPYVIDNGFDIEGDAGSSAVLTLDPGSSLLMGDNGSVVVRGDAGLTLDGTEAEPVTISSMYATPAPGDWNHIELRSDSLAASNRFSHTHFSYGGGSNFGQLSLSYDAEVTLESVTFSESGEGCDIYNLGSVNASNTTWVDCF